MKQWDDRWKSKCLKQLSEMESFQGETADAIRRYTQEVYGTLFPGLRQMLKEYRVRLLLYQKGYYKIDADKNARLPKREIHEMESHMKRQETILLTEEMELKKILAEVQDIISLQLPSSKNLLDSMTEVIRKGKKLDSDIESYEKQHAKEAGTELESRLESTDRAIMAYLDQERNITHYVPGDFEKLEAGKI